MLRAVAAVPCRRRRVACARAVCFYGHVVVPFTRFGLTVEVLDARLDALAAKRTASGRVFPFLRSAGTERPSSASVSRRSAHAPDARRDRRQLCEANWHRR